MHRKDGVVIASEELFLEDFDCGVVFSAEDLAKVDLAGVSLAK